MGGQLSSERAPPPCTTARKSLQAIRWGNWPARHIPLLSPRQNSLVLFSSL